MAQEQKPLKLKYISFFAKKLCCLRFYSEEKQNERILICCYMQRKFPNRVVLTKYIQRLCFVQAVDMRCSKTACNHDKRLKNIMKGQS